MYFVSVVPAGTPVFDAAGLAVAACAGELTANSPAIRAPMTDRAPIQRKRLGGASDDGELNEFTPLQINADEWTWG